MTTYNELLARAQADPQHADFHALRMAYTRTELYAPYDEDAQTIHALRAALQEQNMEAALAAIETLLAENYLDIEAHMAADYVHVQREDDAQSLYHRAFAKGLIDAILATGTGRDFDTAFIVLSIGEEYLVLRMMGLAPMGQRLVQHEGHWFDVLNVQNPRTGEMRAVHFNIDLPRGWQESHSDG